MKKRIDKKYLISGIVAMATVFSLGCMALADETETGDPAEDQIEVTEDIICDVEETVNAEADSAKEGWSSESGSWFYYKNGSKVTGWQEIGGSWYWFESDGKMFIGTRYDSLYKKYFMFGIDGKMLKGWQQCEGYWYYFDNNGKAVTGWQQIGGKWYYFCDQDDIAPFMYNNGSKRIGDTWYYFGYSGEMQTGWKQDNNNYWHYFSPSSGKAAEGWQQIGGNWYYFRGSYSDGPRMVSDNVIQIEDEAGNKDYYGFDKNGVMITGWYIPYEVYVRIDGKDIKFLYTHFYFESNGKAARGWKQIDGKWYFFGSPNSTTSTPMAEQGIIKIEGKYYYFDYETYEMRTGGWINPVNDILGREDEHWIYADSNGVLYSGWKQINNLWYYFGDEDDDPYMRTGPQEIDGKVYFFADNGVMKKGWIKYNGVYFYAESSGACCMDMWKKIDGHYYYFLSDGSMATGLRKVGGQWFDFGTNGAI